VGRTTAAGTGGIQVVGGGMYVYSDATITNSTISKNIATVGTNGSGAAVGFVGGGGIILVPFPTFGGNPQHSTITGSTISGNTSYKQSGGIDASGYVTLTNSTMSGNRAGFAGAMSSYYAQLTLQNSTIAFNTAYAVGGVYAPSSNYGQLTMNSTIIASNTASYAGLAADLSERTTIAASGDNNLIMTMDPAITFGNPQLSADPKLLPLADNGGPTQTHALPADSPAITTGNNVAGLTTDQRGPGFPRSIGGATDIGAFERGDGIFADGFEGP